MGKYIDLTGQTYNRLTAISKVGGHPTRWLWKCSCGNEAVIRMDSVRNGLTRSCGCLQKEIASAIGKAKQVYEGETKTERLKHKKYGLTPDDHYALREKQGFKCAICEKHEDNFAYQLRVDHCHDSGLVRGLLCSGCNSSLGHFGDNVEGLHKALNYLNKFMQENK